MRAILRITVVVFLAFSGAALVWGPVETAPTSEAAPAEMVALVRDATLEPVRGKRTYRKETGFRAPLAVEVNGERLPLAVSAVTVLPGERVELSVPAGTEVAYGDGEMEALGGERFAWTAPGEPGIHALSVRGPRGEVRLNVLVAHPAGDVSNGSLNGYRIGEYRRQPLRGDPAYLPPQGFVQVSPRDHDVLVSPHFTLGEFLCKQPGDPRYLVLSQPLLVKLELILEAANEAGIEAPGLTVMSGYRTPFYNRSIGNTTDYSRHLYGDAADIFIDGDGDGRMDDLNGDGAHTAADAAVLAGVVDDLAAGGRPGYRPGGMSAYRPTQAHGGFVHVDARGQRTRW